MGPKAKQDPESVVKEIKRNTRRQFRREDLDHIGGLARERQYCEYLLWT